MPTRSQNITTLQSLVEQLPRFGARPAVGLRQAFGLRWWSYDRLYRESFRIAYLLSERQIKAGQHVLLQASNCPEWVAVLLGAAMRGIVVVPVAQDATPEFVRHVAEKVDARLFFCQEEQNAQLLGVPVELIFPSQPVPEIVPDKSLVNPVQEDDTALIYFTSGTTTNPRGVIITHRNIAAAIAPFRFWRPLVRVIPFRLLSIPPLSHILGLMLGVCVPLSLGLAVVYTQSVTPEHLIRTIRDNRVTLLAGVPRISQILSRHLLDMKTKHGAQRMEQKLANIRSRFLRRHLLFRHANSILGWRFWVIFMGGAKLPIEEEKFWQETGRILVQGYGLTETTAFATINGPFSGRLGSVGRNISRLEMTVAEDGEILLRGPSVTPGYFEDNEANSNAFQDGFFKTGDLAKKDRRNLIYFLGRKKDVIITSEGRNVYPADVENVLNRQDGVADSVVISSGRNGHEEIHAVLLMQPGKSAPAAVHYANTLLHHYQQIQNWTTWPHKDFPRTSLGKIKRNMISDSIVESGNRREEKPGHVSEIPTVEEIRNENDRIRRLHLLARFLGKSPAEELVANATELARRFDLSSVDMVELQILMEQNYAAQWKDLRERFFASHPDLQELIGALKPEGAAREKLEKPGKWMEFAAVNFIRRLTRPLVIYPWVFLRTGVTVKGRENLRDLSAPFVIAATHHEHAIDVFIIYKALPVRLRRRLMFVSSRWVFREYLDPDEAVSRFRRLVVGAAFHVFAPALFPLIPIPHFGAAGKGISEICRLIDLGYCPIIFLEPGVSLIAAQTQVPVLPVKLEGNEGIDFPPHRRRKAVRVHFGKPVQVQAGQNRFQIMETIQNALNNLGGSAC